MAPTPYYCLVEVNYFADGDERLTSKLFQFEFRRGQDDYVDAVEGQFGRFYRVFESNKPHGKPDFMDPVRVVGDGTHAYLSRPLVVVYGEKFAVFQ